MKKCLILIGLFCLAMAGCAGQQQGKSPQGSSPTQGGKWVEKEVKFQHVQAAGGDQQRNSKPAYKVYLKDLGLAQNLDYSQYFLLVADRGQQASSGYGIKITALKQTGAAEFKVMVQMSDPQPGKYYLTVITNPRDMAAVNRTVLNKGKVTFNFVNDKGENLGTDVVNVE